MPAARPMLNLAVSPYHLSTREPVAAIALTLCDHAVTALPEPAEGRSREQVRAAVDRLPRFLRVLESWRWSGPLWRAGVVGAGQVAPPEHAFQGVAAAGRDVSSESAFARLAATVVPPPPRAAAAAEEPTDAEDRWLDALCTDLLRGGPDPRLSTAVTAALDRFAAAHGYIAVRGPTDSLAQRAEARLARKVFSIALPVMSRAAGGKILDLRNTLAEPLAGLRAAMADAFDAVSSGATARQPLTASAAAYTVAFEEWFAAATRDDENDQRTMREFVSITGAVLPVDAAILSARAAMHGVTRAAGRESARGAAQTTGSGGEPLRALLIRPMNVQPA